jgi:hypothetical protein
VALESLGFDDPLGTEDGDRDTDGLDDPDGAILESILGDSRDLAPMTQMEPDWAPY